jgi:hypothetical protein
MAAEELIRFEDIAGFAPGMGDRQADQDRFERIGTPENHQ